MMLFARRLFELRVLVVFLSVDMGTTQLLISNVADVCVVRPKDRRNCLDLDHSA